MVFKCVKIYIKCKSFNVVLWGVSMVGNLEKIKTLALKNNRLLFIILFVLAVIFKLNKFDVFFGMTIDISFTFIVLILLCFGMRRAVLTEIIISLGYIIFFNGEFIQFIEIIQIIFLGIVCLKRWRLNVLYGSFLFWVIFIVPILLSSVCMGVSGEIKSYYNFTILFFIINCLLNAFLAEVIYVYFIKIKVYKKKLIIKYKNIILHILTLAIIIPFIINMFIDLNNSYSNICTTVETSSEEIYHYIEDEIYTWNEKSITNLKLAGVIEVGILEDTIKRTSRYKPYNINIMDKNNRNILDVINYEGEITRYDEYDKKIIKNNLVKMVPKKKKRYFDNAWIDSYFLYIQSLDEIGLDIRIEVPTKIYNERIIEEHIDRFKILIAITGIIGLLAFLLNKVIFKNLERLSIVTKDLPEKLYKNIEIEWPRNTIEEIETLGKNIEGMSWTLRENFIKLNETQKKLYELAYYDILTGLPNRSFFKQYLDELISEKNDFKVCVMFVDLNRFKLINDNWGHHIGDKLLVKVAERFKKLKNQDCKVFRLGGDEFVFVVKERNNDQIFKTGHGIIKSFMTEFKVDDLSLATNCSIGASIYPDDSEDIDTIIKYADIAMYTSKENGGNYLQLFNEEINEKVIEKIKIEEGVNKALEKDEFILYYQPKFSGETNEVMSLEALIRWENPEKGIIPPNKFIPIAEESDLILEIDKWVIFEACKKNKLLQDEGYKKVPVSVNVSAKHFANREILDIVDNAIKVSGLEAKYLKIEITEGVLIKNVAMVSQMIIDLKKKGVQVSIDDFGKGYSSINQLIALPINEVKIDMDFVKNIHQDEKKKTVVKLIVEIAHSLNLNVVAEGIEIEDEKQYLRSINCDELQGYLFSKPIKLEELKNIL